MWKNWMTLSVVCFFILLIFGLGNVSAFNTNQSTSLKPMDRGSWLYVGGSGPGNYTTIQSAIKASNHGDTIFVYDDSSPYNGRLVIDKQINLIGENKNSTVLDGSGYEVIYVYSNSTVIRDFTITNSGVHEGIYIRDHTNNEIKNCIFTNNSRGLTLYAAPSNHIHNNYFSQNNIYSQFGIYIYGENLEDLTQDITSNTINGKNLYYFINESNVVLDGDAGQLILVDCSDFIIKNMNISGLHYGITLYYCNNITISNSNIYNNDDGIVLQTSSNISVLHCNIFNNMAHGIWLGYSNHNKILNCTISNCSWGGIWLYSYCHYNEIAQCRFVNNHYGIHPAWHSFKTIIKNCVFINNTMNSIRLDESSSFAQVINCTISGGNIGILIRNSNNNIIQHCNVSYTQYALCFANIFLGLNITEENQIQYCNFYKNYYGAFLSTFDLINNTISYCNFIDNVAGIKLEYVHNQFVNNTPNTIRFCNITGGTGDYGIVIDYSNQTKVLNCHITALSYGIVLQRYSSQNTILHNLLSGITNGIELYSSDSNIISNNTIVNCGTGIYADDSDYNTLSNNTISCNYYYWDAVILQGSRSNMLLFNTITTSKWGVELYYNSYFNIIANNSFSDNQYGIYADHSNANTIRNNTFLQSTQYSIYFFHSNNNILYHNTFYYYWASDGQAYEESSDNIWNLPYNQCGNFWSDFASGDNNHGLSQNILGGDGIVDISYIIPGGDNQDHYPLMQPWQQLSPVISQMYINREIQQPGGFINISCQVIDIILVKSVKIHMINPLGEITNISMTNIPSTNLFYYNSTFSLLGGYCYYIYSDNYRNNSVVSMTKIFYISLSGLPGFWVDDDYNAFTPGWHIFRFNTIQGGIDAISGDAEIYVNSGTYHENLVITSAKILIGANRNDTIIDGWIQITGDNASVSGFKIYGIHNNMGIEIIYGNNNTIENCIFDDNYWGMYVWYSEANRISKNLFTANNSGGIYLYGYTCNNTIEENCFNSSNGIFIITNSNVNKIIDNYYTNNQIGIKITGNSQYNYIKNNRYKSVGWGIYLELSVYNNTIQNCSFEQCDLGINIMGWANAGAKYNIIKNNTFLENDIGIRIRDSLHRNNTIFHNNFIDNIENAYDSGNNQWDNDYPSGGNFWFDYTGSDLNGDRIGDIPYIIDGGNNRDWYPLIHKFPLAANFDYIIINRTVAFNASRSNDYQGTIVNYLWDFGDGFNGTGMITNHTYLGIEWSYNITLTVIDDNNRFDSKVQTIIFDNAPPTIIDHTSATAYTGDLFLFNATITDNTYVTNVWVEYWYGTEAHTNISMDNVGGEIWKKTIEIYNTIDSLYYCISAKDIVNLWINTGVKNVIVYDNIEPVISNYWAYPNPAHAGWYVNISAHIIDNIEISQVFLNITNIYTMVGENISITGNRTGDTFYCNRTYLVTGVYVYHFWANDTSSNSNWSIEDAGFYVHNWYPSAPTNPYPPSGTIDIPVDAILSWDCTDPDGDPLVYDVYFGVNWPPPLVVYHQSGETYDPPGRLSYSTAYYWQIFVYDCFGGLENGPYWSFTTESQPPPQQPLKPSGPTSGVFTVEYSYTTRTMDIDGDQVYYWWNWGDGTNSGWLGPYESNESVNASHSWTDPGNYNIKVKAKDSAGAVSVWSDSLSIHIQSNSPPNKPHTPSGPTEGKIGIKYTYTTWTDDVEENQVYYKWDWDYGNYSEWLGPYNSNDGVTASHTWTERGRYDIRVKAKDEHGFESDWSDPLPIKMPKNSAYIFHFNVLQFFEHLFERFPNAFPILRYLLEN